MLIQKVKIYQNKFGADLKCHLDDIPFGNQGAE